VLVRSGVECQSADANLGDAPTLAECANRCAAKVGCSFFIYGHGYKAGRCYQEFTNTSTCAEGWEVDEYDFYQLHTTITMRGCTDARDTAHYNAAANVDDGSCVGVSACAAPRPHGEAGECANCATDQVTGSCRDNQPYRSHKHDLIDAVRVAPGELTVDGDLRDWGSHMSSSQCFQDVPFATQAGDEVVFEAHDGGKWFGPSDFSIRWMLAWDDQPGDDDYLYLAAEVRDDTFQVSGSCYGNGLQVAFEVAGPDKGVHAGELQAERSADLGVSRLQLINAGLKVGQTACSTELSDTEACCVDYELSQQEEGFFRRTKVAVLRNPNSRTTTYELAFHKGDLVGDDHDTGSRSHWREGLTFGFSFLVNDGDESAMQQGWAGYYPHAIVLDWNQGQKRPDLTGRVRLGKPVTLPSSGGGGGSDGGSGFGFFVLGFVVGPLTLVGGLYGYRWYRTQHAPAVGGRGAFSSRTRTSPMAASDQSSFTPPMMIPAAMSSSNA